MNLMTQAQHNNRVAFVSWCYKGSKNIKNYGKLVLAVKVWVFSFSTVFSSCKYLP